MSTFAAFSKTRLLARGPLAQLVPQVHAQVSDPGQGIVYIQESNGSSVDFDWRGTLEQVLERAQLQFASRPQGRGRPKLGVQSREITLLPRHWSWLDQQSGSRSAVLRRLLDREMKGASSLNVDAIYGALSVVAGDLPGFEESSRCLFAGDWSGFLDQMNTWPEHVRGYFQTRVEEGLNNPMSTTNASGC